MAESAVVAGVVLFVIIAVVYGAMYVRSMLGAQNGSSAGVAAAAVAGNSPYADYQILRNVSRSTAALSRGSLDRVVIYKASGPGAAVPDVCTTAPPGDASLTGICNVYVPADLDRPRSDFNGNTTWSSDRSWPPTSRGVSLQTGPDYIGVYIAGRADVAVSMFGGNAAVKRSSTARLEPSAF